jgi:hypothetical protein
MKRVLAVCPSTWDKEMLARPEVRGRYDVRFYAEELYETPPVWRALRFDVHRYIEDATRELQNTGLDGIVGTGDYPGCLLAAELSERLKLPTAGAREVVLFSHKYYSREIQRKLVPHATPAFALVDPFAPHRRPLDGLEYPFFVKPVKGTMSIRARPVARREELAPAVKLTLRERLRAHLLLRPFQQLLDRYSDRSAPAHYFIAEQMLGGVQVTVDGFVENRRPVIMGIVDSVMFPGTMSFKRFDYPSTLPAGVQERMAELTAELMSKSGFDNSCFNVELFYDRERDAIHIIEVNPRMSYQFADLYEKVDGTNTYDIQLRLATGEPADLRSRSGKYGAAASFVLRRFSDAKVVAVPTAERIAEVVARFPGTVVTVLAKPGDRLSDHDQDVGSYRYGIVNMGAATREQLFADWAEVEELLAFSFA